MSPQGGLGRGLGALIPSGARVLEEIPVSAIKPNPKQPRRHFEESSLIELSASIGRLGLLQPVVVRRKPDDRYELVMGERRWRAAHRAGLSMIPALIVETDDRGALERALVENLQRQDLNPIEEAAAYQQLIEEAGLTHEQLAERVGLSRPAVSNALRLLELPDDLQRMVIEGKLSAGHVRALHGLLGNPLILRIAQRVFAEGLSVRQTEDLVRQERDASPASRTERVARPRTEAPGLGAIAERLGDELSTRVGIKMGKGKGKIVIEFGSQEDLERLCRQIAPGAWAEESSE